MTPAAALSVGVSEDQRDRACQGCGIAPPVGEFSDGLRENRMLEVSGPGLPREHWGRYCEVCVALALKVGREQRQQRR